MTEPKFLPSIDPATIIWDKKKYSENSFEYKHSLLEFVKLTEELKNKKILISKELIGEMINEFPASEINQQDNELWASVSSIYAFLSGLGSQLVTFKKREVQDIESCPDQIKPYFKDSVKKEVVFLMSYFHSTPDPKRIYFSFRFLWDESNQLETKITQDTQKHAAVILDRDNELNDFLNQFRLTFEHKPKHDISEHGNKEAWKNRNKDDEFISQLSCFSKGDEVAQKLLEKRYDVEFEHKYYSYDAANEVYVVFRVTNPDINTYHAHDEYDINKIPQEVRKHFNIFKYRWQ